jgi:hypothetical protein
MPRWLELGTTFHFLQAVLRRSATQHWRYSHAERASQCTPSPTIDYHNATQTINCFVVNTRNFGSPPRKGLPQGICTKGRGRRIAKPFHPRSSRVAARQSRPASAIRVLIRRIQHRESRIAPHHQHPHARSVIDCVCLVYLHDYRHSRLPRGTYSATRPALGDHRRCAVIGSF